MFRTRDFVLLFTTVAFLLLAIGVTLWQQYIKSTPSDAGIVLVEPTLLKTDVIVPKKDKLSRADRLALMRQKIAESEDITFTAPSFVADPSLVVVKDETSTNTEPEKLTTENLCGTYQTYNHKWPIGVQIEMTEGARIVYTNDMQIIPATTSTPATKNVLLQLPARTTAAARSSCITFDVVGVAQDGSLIRNSEAGLYGVFGAQTLVGYALDGLPIYGTNDITTDTCGGAVVAGEYRYFIHPKREVILNCFSATPVNL